MKKIINNRKYDTETATLIGVGSNNYFPTDFKYFEERLYLKKTGEYFIYGRGGPMSKYSESTGNGWSSGEDIIPLNMDETRDWVLRYLSVEKYEELFGEVEE